MKTPMTAIEMTGTVDEHNKLRLDGVLPFSEPKRVKVIILSPIDIDEVTEIDEASWLQAASHNPAFAFLADPEEDIYSLNDGVPFHAEI